MGWTDRDAMIPQTIEEMEEFANGCYGTLTEGEDQGGLDGNSAASVLSLDPIKGQTPSASVRCGGRALSGQMRVRCSLRAGHSGRCRA